MEKLKNYANEIICLIIFLLTLILSSSGIIDGWIVALAYIVALVPVGWPILKETAESWLHGDFFNEFSLMLLACIGAFIIGEYPEGVAILLFYSFGEKLEDSASDTARSRIRSLLEQMPEKVRRVRAGVTEEVSPEDVKVGDVIAILPGQRVPLDGTLIGSTAADFDTSAISGESLPQSISPNEEILSGSIPIDKEVSVKVSRAYSDSHISRMMRLIEEAASQKSRSETLLRKITRWYTPTVMLAAALLFAVPALVAAISPSFSFDWMMWLRRSLVLLVCSCPCALVVSIPLSYFMAIGNASSFGLLFKGSRSLDMLRKINTLLLDKTGTLTTGQFHISNIHPASGFDADSILALAAAVDASSTHPLARAICREAATRSLRLPEVSDVTVIPHGLRAADKDGREILIGSPSLVKPTVITDSENNAGSEVCIAIDGKYVGSIYLQDTLKPQVADTLAAMRRNGVSDIEILSGDRRQAVARVCAESGADNFEAQLMPEDKQKILKRKINEGRHVAFIGDGINDAPSLALADVGIAIGDGGTDVAMESADAVLTGSDLTALAKAMRLSRKIKEVVTENVSFAIGVKLLVMTLGAIGIASLWAAVFADTGVTLITVIWTFLRLRTRK